MQLKLYVPNHVRESALGLVGDIDAFMDSFEAGEQEMYWAKLHHDSIVAISTRSIYDENTSLGESADPFDDCTFYGSLTVVCE